MSSRHMLHGDLKKSTIDRHSPSEKCIYFHYIYLTSKTVNSFSNRIQKDFHDLEYFQYFGFFHALALQLGYFFKAYFSLTDTLNPVKYTH